MATCCTFLKFPQGRLLVQAFDPSSGDVKIEDCSSWPEVLADPSIAEQSCQEFPRDIVDEPSPLTLNAGIINKTSFYKCSHCEKHFADQWNLGRHTRIHSGERPFRCEFCPMDFTLKTTLTAHLRTHTGDKPYKCHLCDMAFSWRSSLVKHLKAHSWRTKF
nr:zinc finger protein 600-like [Rhipicephalus microplus]